MSKKITPEMIEKYSRFRSYKFASADDARLARYVFAYMRRNQSKGYPFFIQSGKHEYTVFEDCDSETKLTYFRKHKAHIKSFYFDTYLPVKKMLNEEQLREMHGDLFEDYLGGGNDEIHT